MIALVHPECPNPTALNMKKYDDPVNKDALRKAASGKCMYCESKIEHVSYSQIEHIKPKKRFPELEFIWDNLGFSCQVCNTNKGEKYDKNTPFINPYDENPEDHIVFFGFFAYPKQSSERGEYTIKELVLNRDDLVDRRKDKIEGIIRMIGAAYRTSAESLKNQAIAEIKTEAEKDKEFSAMVKSVLITQEIL
jgi:uncharacterized protein (TIGR02646 family)